MTVPTVSEYLKYANLQMAAEALFTFDATTRDAVLVPGATTQGAIDPTMLERGNLHASKFTLAEATKFAADWQIVEHKSNTETGFSGTLFRAVRSNPASNTRTIGVRVDSFPAH